MRTNRTECWRAYFPAIKKFVISRCDWLIGGLIGLLFLIGLSSIINPLQHGLTASYYANSAWQGEPLAIFREQQINLERMERVFPTVVTDYSIRWEGFIRVPKSGNYQFTLVSDDGSSAFIDGQLVVDNGGFHGKQERTGQRFLEKGNHTIQINYMQGKSLAIFRAYWTPPNGRQQPLSEAALFCENPGGRKTLLFGALMDMLGTISKILCVFYVISFFGIMAYSQCRRFPSFRNGLTGVGIFLLVMVSHFFWSDITTAFDSKWAIHTALCLIREGNTDLDEYAPLIKQYQDYTIEQHNGHTYSTYPIGSTLLALPYVWVVDAFLHSGFSIDFERFINTYTLWLPGIEKFAAANLIALSAVIIYLIAYQCLHSRPIAFVLTFIFAFCTPAWSTASRALWQHGPTILMLSLVLVLLLRAERQPDFAPWAIRLLSLPLSFAYVIRPTNSFSIGILGLLIFMQYRKHFLPFCLWSLMVWVPFLLYNFRVYHALLSPYYLSRGQFGGLNLTFFEGLAGLLVSPSRGLFIFSPILLFAVYGIVIKLKQKQMTLLDVALLSIIVLHWIISALHPHWWGGHSYGPRYFADMLPYLVYFLIPVFQYLPALRGLKKMIAVGLLFGAILISFAIHLRGATDQAVYGWNSGPVNVDLEPSRVWDWHDIQFLRGL